MRILPLFRGALLCFYVSLIFAATFCYAGDKTVEVVGTGECADCAESNIKTVHAFKGLRVTIDCKPENGEFKTRGFGELDEEGKFKVSLPSEVVKDGKLKEECYAQLHSASAAPCPSHDGLESSKIVLKSKTDEKHTFGLAGKLKFSPVTCTSAFLWPHFKYPPLPKLPKWKLPPLKDFHHPYLFPPKVFPPFPPKLSIEWPFFLSYGPHARSTGKSVAPKEESNHNFSNLNKRTILKWNTSVILHLPNEEGFGHGQPENFLSMQRVAYGVRIEGSDHIFCKCGEKAEGESCMVAAARVLSMLFITAYYIEPNSSGNVCFGLDDKQIADIRHSVKSTLVKQLDQNGDLFVATVNLLTAATHYQATTEVMIPDRLCFSCIDNMCSGLKLLNGFRSSVTGVKTIKLMLMLLLLALEISKSSEKESQDFAEVSNVCLGLLPILCNCITATECSSLSLATIDLVLRRFLTPNT
ncbi:hypothetical protein D5086_009090 [Populus alba]|uniref:Uncharacterized protein n=1 Tax=Populus alba TaxID=43335 RepID=A0ACC4CJR5_POPAL